MNYRHLDQQLGDFSGELTTVVKLSEQEAMKVATFIAAEVRLLTAPSRAEILAASPVPLHDRLDELRAFQVFMDGVSGMRSSPALTRAQVIVQITCALFTSERAAFARF